MPNSSFSQAKYSDNSRTSVRTSTRTRTRTSTRRWTSGVYKGESSSTDRRDIIHTSTGVRNRTSTSSRGKDPTRRSAQETDGHGAASLESRMCEGDKSKWSGCLRAEGFEMEGGSRGTSGRCRSQWLAKLLRHRHGRSKGGVPSQGFPTCNNAKFGTEPKQGAANANMVPDSRWQTCGFKNHVMNRTSTRGPGHRTDCGSKPATGVGLGESGSRT